MSGTAPQAAHRLPGTISRLGLWLRLSPLLLPFVVLFCGGLALTVAQSMGFLSPVPLDMTWSEAYRAVLTDFGFWASAMFTLYVAAASAILSVAAGSLLAYCIWRLPRVLQRAAIVYKLALILPHISVAFIVLVFWTQSGFVASLCHALGLIDTPADFPALLFGGNGLGLILAYAFKGTGFATLLGLAVLRGMDQRLVLTARMLGASATSAFLRVALPHMAPALHTAFIILFLYALGGFDIASLLSESHPGMLSIRVYDLFFQRGLEYRPLAMVILTCMLVFSCLFIWLYIRIAKRFDSEARKL